MLMITHSRSRVSLPAGSRSNSSSLVSHILNHLSYQELDGNMTANLPKITLKTPFLGSTNLGNVIFPNIKALNSISTDNASGAGSGNDSLVAFKELFTLSSSSSSSDVTLSHFSASAGLQKSVF